MQEWVKNDAGERRYGMGLTYYDLDVTYVIGHSGGHWRRLCIAVFARNADHGISCYQFQYHAGIAFKEKSGKSADRGVIRILFGITLIRVPTGGCCIGAALPVWIFRHMGFLPR